MSGATDAAERETEILYRDWYATDPRRPVIRVGRHWLVSSRALVKAVLLDQETFAADNTLDAETPMSVAALRILAGHRFRLPHTLANNSGPSHAGWRRLLAPYFSPSAIERHRAYVDRVAEQLVAEAAAVLARDGVVDLHAAVSQPLPLVVLDRIIGLPPDDIATVKRFAAAALELFWAPLTPERQRVLADQVGAYHARLRRFAQTAGGLGAELRDHAQRTGLSDDDVVGVLFFLVVAGQETTSQFLTALFARLLAEPAVLAGLRRGRIAVADVVAEGLRLLTPVVTWRRVATRDVVLGGTTIPRGGSIVLRLAAAGRDPDEVAEPEHFLPGQRGSRRHLAFGAGAHRCLGAQLATMEAEIVVTRIADLLAEAEVVRAPRHPLNLSFRMPDALVVRSAAVSAGVAPAGGSCRGRSRSM
ncbi:cytochrome P450 [Acidothermus cellulolyticus 11B]|uniref:Cytochrome P450 n=1 Tax=Acidothermus cellulolyticus (strain ATCC 43068 / DSM 8971 / 11B) TaxID=351607 RepID=A0LTQ1_ACIC1|nr:cytochrome P450 [Acidothermus cellulolyticus]ABK52811.1 cytochrome P450 [Acidothermus cellulolyticus 11B]